MLLVSEGYQGMWVEEKWKPTVIIVVSLWQFLYDWKVVKDLKGLKLLVNA